MKSFAQKLDELALYLYPPGQGIYTVSTGKKASQDFAQAYLGKVPTSWREHLNQIIHERVALLGLPSDAGAGIMRGAMQGPQGIRARLGHAPVFDLGDIFSIPHFIHDDMLSDEQRVLSQEALYSAIEIKQRAHLPVSPMSIAKRALQLIHEINPHLKILLLGGDHTCAWPMCEWLFENPTHRKNAGIIHFDAHTDLLAHRLGVKYCFGTWAYHANELLGREGRLIQIGIRASAKTQSYWESNYQVKQIWAKEALALGPEGLAEAVIDYLSEKKIYRVYLSNDIDGTDSYWANACGTPEPEGLTPEHVIAVIRALKSASIEVLSADLVEVAPGLSLDSNAATRTLDTAVRYITETLAVLYPIKMKLP